MRKHIDYYYKCFDKENDSEIEQMRTEKFNEYGYNFDTNKRRVKREEIQKLKYKNCLNLRKENK